MKPQPAQFAFEAQGGSMPFTVAQLVSGCLRTLTGKRVRITIEPVRYSRSGQQNRYYWGVVIPMVQTMFTDAGNIVEREEVHLYIKLYVWKLTDAVIDPSGAQRTIVKSSTNMTTKEWEARMEQVRAWAAGFGVIIPLPNETEYWEGVDAQSVYA